MSAFFKMAAGNANLLDPQDFEANRRGEITEAQKQRLNSMSGWGQGCVALIVLFFIGPFLCFMSFIFIEDSLTGILIPLLIAGSIFLLFLLLMGRILWNLWSNNTKLKRDQANRAIRQGQGQLSYSKKGYVFQVNDLNLVLPANGTGGLLPGAAYRVHYLEESRFLLSAEESYPAGPTQVRAAMSEILAAANEFSFEDLSANHNGETTFSQRRKLLPKALVGVFLCLLGVVFLVVIVFFAFSSNLRDTRPTMFIFGIMAAVFLVLGGFLLVNALVDMFISAPQQIQGLAHKEKRVTGGKHRTTHYYYVIGGQSFEISYRAYEALIDGLEYRIYYLPRTKQLISIEAL